MTRDEKDFIDTARAEFKRDVEEERELREEAAKDMDFRVGDQWDPRVKAQRESEGRPALTFDRTHVFIQSVANEARQNKSQPKCNPLGGGATTDTATVLNGILRHIQYRSKADVASDCALDQAAGSSFGYIRAIAEYSDPKSFDQELRILPVLDPFSVYGVLIPKCLGHEPPHAFVVETISRERYKSLYGDEEEASNFESPEWQAAGDWLTGESVRIAEYWKIEEKKRTMRAITHPQGGAPISVYTDEPEYHEGLPFVLGDDGKPLERVVMEPTVRFCKIDGRRELPNTRTTWVGDTIPIEPVVGQQLVVKGKIHLFSLIRFIRDAQYLINLYESAIAEKVALSNRVPYIGYKGQFNDPRWDDANVRNYAYLEVDEVTIGGKPAPLPQRQQLEEQITALTQAVASKVDGLKSGMGIFDASLGQRSNETSGVGIRNRQQQSNVTNFHFSDNLNFALWGLCLKLLKAIPKIYDRPGRQVRIVGEDQEHSVVIVNQPYRDQETGKPKHYPLDVGEYDVVVTVGPSSTTARAEGADTLQQFFQAAPQSVPLLGDLWVGSLDYPWAREAARRLKAAAPPQIVNEEDQNQQKIPPQVQAQMQQMGQQHDQLVQLVHTLQNEIDAKKQETDSRERIVSMQEETKRAIAFATIDQRDGIHLLTQEIQVLQAKRDKLHDMQMQGVDQAHAQQMQDGQQSHEADQASQSQMAAADSQDSSQQHASEQQQSAQSATADQQLQKAA